MIPFVMETIILYCNCQIYFYLHFITAASFTFMLNQSCQLDTHCMHRSKVDIQVVEITSSQSSVDAIEKQ